MMITQYKRQSGLKRLKLVALLAVGLVFPLSSAHSDTLTLDLKQATRIALENNHTLAAASYKVHEAKSGVKIAKTQFLPKLNAQATYTRLDEIPYLDASAFGNLFEPLQAPFEDLVNNGYLDPSTLSGL